jgi:hypothetical protein
MITGLSEESSLAMFSNAPFQRGRAGRLGESQFPRGPHRSCAHIVDNRSGALQVLPLKCGSRVWRLRAPLLAQFTESGAAFQDGASSEDAERDGRTRGLTQARAIAVAKPRLVRPSTELQKQG